jgi:hypothetical protein
MTLPQRATRGIVEYQKGNLVHDAEIQHAYNVGMHQASEGAGFPHKPLQIISRYFRLQQLEGDGRSEKDMLAEVDISKATATDEPDYAVISQLLSSVVCHIRSSFPGE